MIFGAMETDLSLEISWFFRAAPELMHVEAMYFGGGGGCVLGALQLA